MATQKSLAVIEAPTPGAARRRAAHAYKNYYRLANLAQQAITYRPSSPHPWLDLAVSFYALRRYIHAADAATVALTLTHVKHTRANINLLIRAALLNDRLKRPCPPHMGVTARLVNGWYGTRLRELIDSGRLHTFPKPGAVRRRQAEPSATLDDCVVVACHPAQRGRAWNEVFARGGDGRRYPADVLRGFPFDQATGGYVYRKNWVASFGCECYDEGRGPCYECIAGLLPCPVVRFPKFSMALPAKVEILGGRFLDVHVGRGVVPTTVHDLLKVELEKLGALRPDSPAPKYHNIIDPNIAAVDGVWVPTEFDVLEVPASEVIQALEHAIGRHSEGSAVPAEVAHLIKKHAGDYKNARCSIASNIPDLDPHRHAALYLAIEGVLQSALPMLSNLQLPALLLPGPLQVVVKAQRIVLETGDVYEGVWHDDGLREHVIAVVLYYYGVSPSLTGGAMEIASKMGTTLGQGDHIGYYFNEEDTRRAIAEKPRCIAPVAEGTMLVFSNYAAVHRVLRMEAAKSAGSRDFLAFFVIDQTEPLAVPTELGPREERLHKRGELLREQLQVRDHFGVDETEVCSTGNGTVVDLAWLRKGDVFPTRVDIRYWDHGDGVPESLISRLNLAPPVIGRGSSYLNELDMPAAQFNPASPYMLHIVEEVDQVTHVFVETNSWGCTTAVPEVGIRATQYFDNADAWRLLGVWSAEQSLREGVLKLGVSGSAEISEE